jgi:hypothetical protein
VLNRFCLLCLIGYGDQPIYRATAMIASSSTPTLLLDSIATTFGVRALTVSTNPHLAGGWEYTQFGPMHAETQPWGWGSWSAKVAPPIPPNATAWQIRINGRPVFARGGNWVPRCVRNTHLYCAILYSNMHHFTKTGSGRT